MNLSRIALVALVLISISARSSAEAKIELNAEPVYLGTPGAAEWSHFEGREPVGERLELSFQASRNEGEATLYIHQEDVKYPWKVMLNGKSLGELINREVALVSRYAIPPHALVEGRNELAIVPPGNADDIALGAIWLDSKPFGVATEGTPLSVKVVDGRTGEALPCRITIADEKGVLVPVYTAPEQTLPAGRGRGEIPVEKGQRLAVRTGVVYTPDGTASFGLLPGNYTIYASRGFEYSVSSRKIVVKDGSAQRFEMEIERSVATEGWVAADSHIHTVTYSGHGDATIDEGMVTIAGEGIEFAVATDHNHHTDYRPSARKMGVSEHFTSIIGNEVTTKVGHFNAFPVVEGSSLPDSKLLKWPELMQSIRSHTGARVIVLNHPRNIHSGFSPMSPEHFRQATGENLRDDGFGFEAMEIVTSAALQSDLMTPIRDWFGILNRGYKVTGVGSSDTHYVSRMILGQGRSYVKANDSDPHALNTDEIVESYRQGRVSVSMGLLVDIAVNDRYGIGDLATSLGDALKVDVNAVGPHWVVDSRESPFETQLFFNGYGVRKAIRSTVEPLAFHFDGKRRQGAGGTGRGALESKMAPKRDSYPKHDFWIVAVATGPGVKGPFWAIPRPYQPTSKVWTSRVIGVTNPVWVDADGDGEFTSAYEYAVRLMAGLEDGKLDELIAALGEYDQAVAAQVASLLHAKGVDLLSPEVRKALGEGSMSVNEGFMSFVETLL